MANIDNEIDSAIAEGSDEEVSSIGEEITLKDIEGNWIKNPAVGESTEILTIEKLMKNFKIDARKKDGKAFKTNLSGTDYKIDIYTDKGIYSPHSWEVWGKVKAMLRKAKTIKDVKFQVQHVADGMKDSKAKDAHKCYKVVWVKSDGTTEEFF